MNIQQLPIIVQNTIREFILPYSQSNQVEGIILVGSYSHSIPDDNSDIDIYIIMTASKTRERGNLFINSLEIEYFINPINQVKQYMRTESELRPITAHMLANGIILYEKSNSMMLQNLIEEANKIIKRRLPELTTTQIELFKYYIDDLEKDLEDTIKSNNSFAYHFIAIQLTNKCIEFICQYYRVIQFKSKRLSQQLKELDPVFFELLMKVFEDNNQHKHVLTLIRYIEKLLGGKRTKTWKLISDLTIQIPDHEN